MARTVLSPEYLRNWLNDQLKKHDQCGDCDFGGITMLQGTDHEGCNWSDPALRCHGQPADICAPVPGKVLADARAKFNIK